VKLVPSSFSVFGSFERRLAQADRAHFFFVAANRPEK
jgi:hypothetical protein